MSEHSSVTLPRHKNSVGVNVVLAFQFVQKMLNKVHVVNARRPRTPTTIVNTAVVACWRRIRETGQVSRLDAVVHQASVPRDVTLAVLSVKVSVASWEQGNKVVFFSELAIGSIVGRPLVTLSMEIHDNRDFSARVVRIRHRNRIMSGCASNSGILNLDFLLNEPVVLLSIGRGRSHR